MAAALLIPSVVGVRDASLVVPVPLEAALAAVLLVLTPGRARQVLGTGLGVLLGLVTVLKLVDLGFFAVLAKQFDLLFDWTLLGNGYEFLRGSMGTGGALGAAAVALAVTVAVIASSTWAVRRLGGVVARQPGRVIISTAAVVTLTLPVVVAPALVGREPLDTGITVATNRVRGVADALADRERFAAELETDPYAGVPGANLLAALRGKDVVVTFVESYGRDAVEDPRLAGPIQTLLDDGTRRLAAAGYSSRSAFLTSSTFGGSSWLAHGSLLAGCWVDSQQRYRQLVASDRLTLNKAFRSAGWRTVGLMPGTTGDWPEGAFFGFDRTYDARTLGYSGPNFSWATMPDQYTLSAFRRLEHGRTDRPPVMAEIQLVSSHAPWRPTPALVDWPSIRDGSVFDGMADVDEPASVILTRDPDRVRADYVDSIAYTLRSLLSYVETYGDQRLVLVFLGDHQPNPIVTGDAATHDVPITVVTADPAVIRRIEGWRWTPGLRPAPQAPVWRMDAFRDRFLATFGSASSTERRPR